MIDAGGHRSLMKDGVVLLNYARDLLVDDSEAVVDGSGSPARSDAIT